MRPVAFDSELDDEDSEVLQDISGEGIPQPLADVSGTDDSSAGSGVVDTGEHAMLLVPLEAVLVSLIGDFPGRSKLTNWQYQSGTYNGGWCMCRHRSHKTPVRSPTTRLLQC